MTVVVAQLGARMHYAVPRILHNAGLLDTLYTDICAVKGWPRLLSVAPAGLLPASLKRLRGRIPHGIPPARIVAFTAFGQKYSKRRREARSASEMTAVHLWASDRFHELIKTQGFGAASLVYGFNSASEGMLKAAKAQGLRAVVEQTSAPRMVELRIRESELSESVGWEPNAPNDNAAAFAEREHREWKLADLILCASEFVRQSVAAVGGPVEKCRVVPYGVELADFSSHRGLRRQRPLDFPLQVLFVGGVGSMKGVAHLLRAMRRLDDAPIHCRVVGEWRVDPDVLRRHTPRNVELVGPVARAEIAGEYERADVFCLPSLCEGSATVVYEALAAGLPVVTTPNSGSIIRNGLEGFIVPIRDADAIAARLEQLATDRLLLETMSVAARARSAYGSLDAYGERLLDALGFKSADA